MLLQVTQTHFFIYLFGYRVFQIALCGAFKSRYVVLEGTCSVFRVKYRTFARSVCSSYHTSIRIHVRRLFTTKVDTKQAVLHHKYLLLKFFCILTDV